MKEIKAFKCGFCSKKYERKHACLAHEQRCYKNPDNEHKCFDYCEHLKLVKDIEEKTQFYCEKKKLWLYSYKIEHKYNFKEIVWHKGQERMQGLLI